MSFFNFKNPEYNQLGNTFITYLSSLDLLFDLESKSKEYLEKNFYIISS